MSSSNWLLYCLWVGMSVLLLVLQHCMHKASQGRADRIAKGLDALRSSETSIVSFSIGFDGVETVCVTDVWTGYSEQCFVNSTIEDALEDAVRFRSVIIYGE